MHKDKDMRYRTMNEQERLKICRETADDMIAAGIGDYYDVIERLTHPYPKINMKTFYLPKYSKRREKRRDKKRRRKQQ